MVTARARTVLTPAAPKVVKVKPTEERAPILPLPGRRYRLRPTEPNPFDGFDPPTYGDDLDAMRALLDASTVPAILEEHIGAGYGALRERPVLTVEMLSKMRPPLARPVTIMLPRRSGEMREDTRWEITPEGQQMLLDSMRP